MKSDTSCTDAKEAPPTLSQLQSSVSSGPQDENYPPRSGPRFPAPPLPMPNLGDDRQANNHGLTRSSAPLSPPRYPHTGAPRSNSNVPTTPSNDTGERDTVSTSPATQPIPIQSIIPGPAAPSIGVVSSLPAPDAAFNTNMARTLAEAHSQKPKSNEGKFYYTLDPFVITDFLKRSQMRLQPFFAHSGMTLARFTAYSRLALLDSITVQVPSPKRRLKSSLLSGKTANGPSSCIPYLRTQNQKCLRQAFSRA